MKAVAIIFLASVAFAHTLSTPKKEVTIPIPEGVNRSNPRFVQDIVSRLVEEVSTTIKDQGFDPFISQGLRENIGLPVPVLFDASLNIENIQCTGLSEIVINNIQFSLFPPNRLTLDISLPHIDVFIGDAGFDLTVLGRNFVGKAKNVRVGVIEAGISGTVQINIGIISGININSIDLQFNLRDVLFEGNINLLGIDISSAVSNFATVWIPNRLNKLQHDINELIEIVAWSLIDNIL